jgi:ABC-2 type transport system ATP-binding protein
MMDRCLPFDRSPPASLGANQMLEIATLTCSYGSMIAVDNVTLRVDDGHICGLVGRNAAGKTTTMRAVVGLVNPTSGHILWNGHRPRTDDRRRFAYFPAQRGLYPQLPVRDQLIFVARIHGMTPADAGTAVATWLERLGIAQVWERPLKSLSEGQQQRVQLAACMVHQPALAVLDEPFALLDPEGSDLLRSVLRELADQGCTVLISSNQLDVLEHVCDDIAILAAGRLVDHGALDDIRARTGQQVDIRFADPPTVDWDADLADVQLHYDSTHRVTIHLGATADRRAVLAAADAAGHVVELWWGPRRLRDLYRDALVEQP